MKHSLVKSLGEQVGTKSQQMEVWLLLQQRMEKWMVDFFFLALFFVVWGAFLVTF